MNENSIRTYIIIMLLHISSLDAMHIKIANSLSFRLVVARGLTTWAACHLFQKIQEKQNPDYTINLMWINKDLQPNQTTLFRCKNNNDSCEKRHLTTVVKWASSNPKSTVHLWFDSTVTPVHAIRHTESTISMKIKEQYPDKVAPIVLKDVRDLSYIQKHSEVFSDKTPVYFRADLMRTIAGLETLKKAVRKTHFVYTDLDVEPMSQKELFDKETKKNLATYGIVVTATDSPGGFENSFYILSSQASHTHKALKRILVKLNTKRAYSAFNGKFGSYGEQSDSTEPLEQIVYGSHELMFKYLYHLQKRGTLNIDSSTPYDYQKHGLEPFGINCSRLDPSFEVKDETIKLSENRLRMPTKKVVSPPTRFAINFYD